VKGSGFDAAFEILYGSWAFSHDINNVFASPPFGGFSPSLHLADANHAAPSTPRPSMIELYVFHTT
jgi:hypothetical protein